MIKMLNIASGSKGNASLIYNDDTLILVDMGLSKSALIEGLSKIQKTIEQIDFALFTHEHCDHIKGIDFIPLEKRYARNATVACKPNHYLGIYQEYRMKSIMVTPLLTSHDALSPCGFLFENNGERLAYITDTGFIPEITLKYINNCEYYYIESNHDPLLLINSNRPQMLKSRIFSDFGHLSNEQSAEYMVTLVGNKTKDIMLAHLSEECDTPELAIAKYREVFAREGVSLQGIRLICAKQWQSIELC